MSDRRRKSMPEVQVFISQERLSAPLTSVICGFTEIRITWLTFESPQIQILTVCPILKQKEQRRRNHKTQYGLKAAPTSLLWPCNKKSRLTGARNETPGFSRFTKLLSIFKSLGKEDSSCQSLPLELKNKALFCNYYSLLLQFYKFLRMFGICWKNLCLV